MTSVRYTEYTYAQALDPVDLPGIDVGLLTLRVSLPAIARNTTATIFTLKGPGKIKSILSSEIRTVEGPQRAGDTQNQALTIAISGDGRSVNLTVANTVTGAAIAAGDVAYLILAAGY